MPGAPPPTMRVEELYARFTAGVAVLVAQQSGWPEDDVRARMTSRITFDEFWGRWCGKLVDPSIETNDLLVSVMREVAGEVCEGLS